MKLVMKRPIKAAAHAVAKNKAKAEPKPRKKRRSEKEIAYLYLLERMDHIATEMKHLSEEVKERISDLGDGRRLAENHYDKIAEVVERRLEVMVAPVVKLLAKRELIDR